MRQSSNYTRTDDKRIKISETAESISVYKKTYGSLYIDTAQER